MSEVIIVAVLSLIGTLAGSWAGVRQANKLVNFRIDLLEKKVDKHNKLTERLIILEAKVNTLAEKKEEDDC